MPKFNVVKKIKRMFKSKPKASTAVPHRADDPGYSPTRDSAKKMFRKDRAGVDAKVKKNVATKSENYNRNADVEKAKNSKKFGDHFNRNAKPERIKAAETKVKAAEAKDTKVFRRHERESLRSSLKRKRFLNRAGAVVGTGGVVAGVGYNEHRKQKNSWENVTKERIRGRQA